MSVSLKFSWTVSSSIYTTPFEMKNRRIGGSRNGLAFSAAFLPNSHVARPFASRSNEMLGERAVTCSQMTFPVNRDHNPTCRWSRGISAVSPFGAQTGLDTFKP